MVSVRGAAQAPSPGRSSLPANCHQRSMRTARQETISKAPQPERSESKTPRDDRTPRRGGGDGEPRGVSAPLRRTKRPLGEEGELSRGNKGSNKSSEIADPTTFAFVGAVIRGVPSSGCVEALLAAPPLAGRATRVLGELLQRCVLCRAPSIGSLFAPAVACTRTPAICICPHTT